MSKLNNTYSVIVPAQSPELEKHVYTQVYGGSTGCSITINGVSVSVGASSKINIKINTITGGNGCFLLGDNKDVFFGYGKLN